MQRGYFITGTDTDVGKTWATISLMQYFKNQGKTVIGMKPVAAGCLMQNGRFCNEDALLIQANSSIPIGYELINPYAYEAPVSPHLAGVNNPVRLDTVRSCFDQLKAQAEVLLVEGAGGWFAPINAQEDIADLAIVLALPVILVVAVRLGCINHAKLSYQAILYSGLQCAGWIAVCNDPRMQHAEENISRIKKSLAAPLLGVLPYCADADFDALAEAISVV